VRKLGSKSFVKTVIDGGALLFDDPHKSGDVEGRRRRRRRN
jgi:hypothetical protein